MSTIILSSNWTLVTSGLFDDYVPKPLGQCKIAYIITPSKKVFDLRYIEKRRAKMKELQRDVEEIDIAGMSQDEVRTALQDKEVVYVEWGNAFYLLKCLRESGFAEVIDELIQQGVVYIWSSAGAYIMTPSIIPSTWSSAWFDRCGITDYSWLSYVPFIIKAHYISEKHQKLVELTRNLDTPVRALADGQAVLVKDDDIRVIWEGEAVVF